MGARGIGMYANAMHARTRRDARGGRHPTGHVLNVAAAWKTGASLFAVAAIVAGIVVTNQASPHAVAGEPADVWLSGEARGQIVLGAARGERPSMAIALGTAGSQYDVVDAGNTVYVQDRSSGAVTTFDSRTSAKTGQIDADGPIDDRAALVGAGDAAYLVDASKRTVQRIDGQAGEVRQLEDGFTEWVGTEDGTLWLLDREDGSYTTFDGAASNRSDLFAPGSEAMLTSTGLDPVVYDVANDRLRWPRRASSIEIPGHEAAAGQILVQAGDTQQGCVAVLAARTLSCIGPRGVERTVQLATDPGDLDGAQLLATPTDAVVVRPGDPRVGVIGWTDGSYREFERPSPSPRALTASMRAGVLVVDDPGSQFAFSLDRGQLIDLDKFYATTTVVDTDGNAAEVASGAPVIGGEGPGGPSSGAGTVLDAGDRNDPPVARPDRSVTRVGRAVTVDVLANDADPDGDPLAVTSAGPPAPGQGEVSIIKASQIRFDPPDASTDRSVTFPYRIVDLGNLESASTVTVEVIASDRNTAPHAADDEASTLERTSAEIDVLGNDTDDEGDPLAIAAVGRPTAGTAAIVGGQLVKYEPNPDFSGTDTFTYDVVDGFGGRSTATVRVRVGAPSGSNRSPIALDDRVIATSGQTTRIQPLANDNDPDGDDLSIVAVSPLPGAEVTIESASIIDFTPARATTGLVTFSYTITDPDGHRASANVAVVVQDASSSSPPVAVDDFAISPSRPITIDLLANDSDPAGQPLAIVQLSAPSNAGGSVDQVSTRAVQFTPTTGFVGTTSFDYVITDTDGRTARATVNVVVTAPSGSGPVARNDTVSVLSGQVIVIDALANDSHADRMPFSYAGSPVVRSGSAVINADRTITFTPPTTEPATYHLTYTIADAAGRTSTADITVIVQARPEVNRPPIAEDDVRSTPARTAVVIDVLANDTDPDGDVLTLAGVTEPPSGTADITGRTVRYTPAAGTSGVVSFAYTVSDGAGHTATATVAIQVIAPVPAPPRAADDLVSLTVGTAATINPLVNDVDPDGTLIGLVLGQIGTPVPAGGITATLALGGVHLVAGQTPGIYTVAYTVLDLDRLIATATITVVVTAAPNRAPVAVDDVASGMARGAAIMIPVLQNDTDPDGGAITLTTVGSVTPAGAGTASMVDGAVRFVPTATAPGSAAFSYTIRDAQLATASATVTVTLTACPAIPALPLISTTTRFEQPTTIDLNLPSPAPGTMSISAPSAGTATLDASSGTVNYTPPAGFNGDASLTYSVRTACNDVATGTIRISVNSSAPDASNDTASTSRNEPTNIDVLRNDSDRDGEPVTLVSVGGAPGGSTENIGGGIVRFTPNPGFVGTTSFSYTVRDPGGRTDSATVTVTVDNAAPVVGNPAPQTIPTQTPSISVDVLDTASDPNGDPLSVVGPLQVSPASAGQASISGRNVVFRPADGLGPSTVSVTYNVSDGIESRPGTLTIRILNQAPVANTDPASINLSRQTSVPIDVLDNDRDPDGATSGLRVIDADVAAAAGSVSWLPNGPVTFVPSSSLTGPSTVIISYRITDPDGGIATGTIMISVTQDPPDTTTTQPPDTTPP